MIRVMLSLALVFFLASLVGETAAFYPSSTSTFRRSSAVASGALFSSRREHFEIEERGVTKTNPAEKLSNRRSFFRLLTAGVLSTSALTTSDAAQAYQKSFPAELTSTDTDAEIDSRQRRVSNILQQEAQTTSGFPPLNAALWGVALWFLSGSRSNPLITPLANVFYDPEKEEWLKDRNDGLFANIPATLYLVLAIVFFAFGRVTDLAVVGLAEGNQAVSLQLAGVMVMGGATLELGRIASGEKAVTRDESDRAGQLQAEFEQFAADRLLAGGNCHRSDVVRAFRRFFAKYRQADDPENPLTDYEIEQLLRNWSRKKGVEMSSAGFYSGIMVNSEADVFVNKR